MFILYNVCSLNWGIFSTSGDVHYMGDIMSTSGHVQYIRGYHYECGGYHVYIGGCSVHQRNTISTLGGGGGGGYHEYIGGCLAHQRDIMMHLRESNLINPFNFY